MGRERGEQASSDLFSTGVARDTSPPPPATEATAEPAPQRHVLPNDLRNAVKHLNDKELDSLHAATFEEMKRRGRLPPSVGADSAQSSRHPLGSQTKRMLPTNKTPQRRQADIPETSLTRGQINAASHQQELRDNSEYPNQMLGRRSQLMNRNGESTRTSNHNRRSAPHGQENQEIENWEEGSKEIIKKSQKV
jgi:hypothetical protein